MMSLRRHACESLWRLRTQAAAASTIQRRACAATAEAAAAVPSGTFYERLGVAPTATASALRDAYRRHALTSHPDVVPPAMRARAEARFRSLSEAFQALSDPAARARYDASIGLVVAVAPVAEAPASKAGVPFSQRAAGAAAARRTPGGFATPRTVRAASGGGAWRGGRAMNRRAAEAVFRDAALGGAPLNDVLFRERFAARHGTTVGAPVTSGSGFGATSNATASHGGEEATATAEQAAVAAAFKRAAAQFAAVRSAAFDATPPAAGARPMPGPETRSGRIAGVRRTPSIADPAGDGTGHTFATADDVGDAARGTEHARRMRLFTLRGDASASARTPGPHVPFVPPRGFFVPPGVTTDRVPDAPTPIGDIRAMDAADAAAVAVVANPADGKRPLSLPPELRDAERRLAAADRLRAEAQMPYNQGQMWSWSRPF